MKPKFILASLLTALTLSLFAPAIARAAEVPKSDHPKIYDESADGAKQISEALAAAKKDNKLVLLQFGANWCIWCHRLHKLFDSNEAVSKKLKSDYVVVMIDVDKGHNQTLVSKYDAVKMGLPFIVVIDADGKHVVTKNTGELEEGDHHSPDKVMAFLNQPKAK